MKRLFNIALALLLANLVLFPSTANAASLYVSTSHTKGGCSGTFQGLGSSNTTVEGSMYVSCTGGDYLPLYAKVTLQKKDDMWGGGWDNVSTSGWTNLHSSSGTVYTEWGCAKGNKFKYRLHGEIQASSHEGAEYSSTEDIVCS